LINTTANTKVVKEPRGVRREEVQAIIMSGELNAAVGNGLLFLG